MFCRTLCLILLSAGQAVAQTELVVKHQSPSNAERCTFEIRFISAKEEFIRPLRKMKNYQLQPIETAPFSTWSQLDAKSPIRIQKSETQVISEPRMSIIEISEKQAFNLIQRAQGDSRTNIMYAPKVKSALGETAVVSDTSVNLSAESKATSGVQIHLRANAIENEMIQADTEIVFRGRASDAPDRIEKTTISFSGLLRSESLTMVVVPAPLAEEEPTPKSTIQRVSNVVRRRRTETPEPTQLLIMITVIAPGESESVSE